MKAKPKHKRHPGSSLVEYMLVLVLIAGACYASLNALGISITKVLDNATQTLTSAMNGP
jgi:Flp pilus assembly pilin Flp